MKILKPLKNLSTNVGTGIDATHTKKMPLLEINSLSTINPEYRINLELNYKNEKIWRRFRLILLVKSLFLKVF
jgi:hypothetical protein